MDKKRLSHSTMKLFLLYYLYKAIILNGLGYVNKQLYITPQFLRTSRLKHFFLKLLMPKRSMMTHLDALSMLYLTTVSANSTKRLPIELLLFWDWYHLLYISIAPASTSMVITNRTEAVATVIMIPMIRFDSNDPLVAIVFN